tara:strand:+ start:162 stop:1370 length:1209 start_codon:yes stop_codon:yes gene_type:complete
MIAPRSPIYLSHAPTPKIKDFALLAALEAGVRGTLLSVMPVVIYRGFSDAATVSHIYFLVGLASLFCGLMVPWMSRWVPRRWMFTLAGCAYLVGLSLASTGVPDLLAFALLINAVGTVTFTVCLNAYVLDHIHRMELGRNETTRMVYSAAPWMIGPILGVTLLNWWTPAPFLLAGVFALLLIGVFWKLRLGDGKQISRARAPAVNPVAYLGRFFAQPRLIAGWFFAVMRSCGWWVFVVYLPIFSIENGLGDKVGALALSISNGLLFTTPLMLRKVNRSGVRQSVRLAFAFAALFFALGWALSASPWATVISIMAASIFLVALDVCGGLPFLMAVRPAERTEMAAVYASFRDVSGIVTPGAAALVLLVAPVSGVFAAAAVGLGAGWLVAGRLHPRLGLGRRPT